MRVCVIMLSYIVINLFDYISIIVICLNTFFFFFPEIFCSFTCYIDGTFQRKFPFKNNRILSYFKHHSCSSKLLSSPCSLMHFSLGCNVFCLVNTGGACPGIKLHLIRMFTRQSASPSASSLSPRGRCLRV